MTPVITIKYQDRPIRVVGLPDTPFFLLEDMHVLIPCTKKRFIRDLELFSTEYGDALNLAGVYMLIATGLNNFGESTYLRSIERFFVDGRKKQAIVEVFPSALDHDKQVIHLFIQIIQHIILCLGFGKEHTTSPKKWLYIQFVRGK
jgi:hypothetical protein